MKIFKSFGEFVTVFLLVIVIISFIMYSILKNGSSAKYTSLENNAIRFSEIVGVNMSSFSNEYFITLEETVENGYMSNIKSPFSSNYCDKKNSYIEVIGINKYVTLVCDGYMLYKYSPGETDYTVYKISKWNDKKKDNYNDSMKLYNCDNNGKELFNTYLEEGYFLYKLGVQYDDVYYNIDSINNNLCKVVSKNFYREKKAIN